MANYKKFTKKKKEIVLEVIRQTGNVSKAARTVGVSTMCVYDHARPKSPQYDEEFKLAWDAAKEAFLDDLEEEAHFRAYHGVDKPVIYQGEITDTYKEKSDTLLMFLLNGNRGHKFGKNRTELSGPGGEPIETRNKSVDLRGDISEKEAADAYMDLIGGGLNDGKG